MAPSQPRRRSHAAGAAGNLGFGIADDGECARRRHADVYGHAPNGSQNKGVAWSLAGTGCSAAACGTVSPGSSLSGTSVTYTAPMVAPSGTVTVTATSSVGFDEVRRRRHYCDTAADRCDGSARSGQRTGRDYSAIHCNGTKRCAKQRRDWQLLGSSCEDFGCGTLSATSLARPAWRSPTQHRQLCQRRRPSP